MYYYIDNFNKQQGPVPADQLVSHGVTGESMVFKAGMTQWTKAKDVPELSVYFPNFNSDQTQFGGQGGYGGAQGGYGGGQIGYGGGQGGFGGGQFNAGQFNNPGGQKPDNHMIWAILSTVLCCIPLGAFAIYYASKVDSTWAMGDAAGAEEYAEKAKKFAIASACTSLVFSIIYVIIGVSNM